MYLAPVEKIKVFRIPGFIRHTTTVVEPYLDAKRGLLVGEHVKSSSWLIEPYGCLLLFCAAVALV